MADQVQEFGANLSFLRLLNLARTDTKIREAFERKDYALISAFPGLTEDERNVLRLFNWKELEIAVTDQDLANFDASASEANKEVCERSVAKEVAERKCYKI
jgi:hypothetical protein